MKEGGERMEKERGSGSVNENIDIVKTVNYLWPLGAQAMSNRRRWKIFAFIVNHKEEKLLLRDITRAFPNIPKRSIVSHLQKLQEANLVACRLYYQKEAAHGGAQPLRYYSVTSWGEIFWRVMRWAKIEALKMFAADLDET